MAYTNPDNPAWWQGNDPTGGQNQTMPLVEPPGGAPSMPTVQAPNNSSGNPWDWLQGVLGLGNKGGTAALTVPMLASALNQWKDSDRYLEYGREAAGMASPISNDERMKSLAQYRMWETDPNKFLETNPVYQGALRQGLNAAERSGASKGLLGSGEMLMSLNRVGQDTAGKFIQEELKRLREDAGFQFNPAHAAQLYMQGAQQSIDSRNGALGSAAFALQNLAQGGQPTGGNPNGGPNIPRPNGGGGGSNGGGGSPGSAVQQIQNAIRQGLRVDPNDPVVAAAIREMTGGSTPWNAGGYFDDMTYGDGSSIDVDSNGEIDFDEWANWNNDDVMNQLGGGDFQGIPDDFNWDDPYNLGDVEWDYEDINWDDFNWDMFD